MIKNKMKSAINKEGNLKLLLSFLFAAAGLIMFTASASAADTLVKTANITIMNSEPFIYDEWELFDENTYMDGTQVWPNPAGNKTVIQCAIVCDNNGIGNIDKVKASVIYPDAPVKYEDYLAVAENGTICRNNTPPDVYGYFMEKYADGTCTMYGGNFTMHFWEPAGDYMVIGKVNDSYGASGNKTDSFEYMPVIGIENGVFILNFTGIIPGSEVAINGDSDMATENPTVRNIGNVELDLNIAGTNIVCTTHGTCFSATIPVSNLTAGFDFGAYNLTIPGTAYGSISNPAQGLPLECGQMSTNLVNFKLKVPQYAPPGNYSATVTLTGVIHIGI